MRPRQARLSEAFATSATSDVGGAGVGDVEDCDDKYRASHRRRVHRASGKMLAVLVSTAAGAIILGRLYHQKRGGIMPAGDEVINPPGSDVGDRPWPEAFIIGAPKAATTSLFAALATHPDVCEPRGVDCRSGKGAMSNSKEAIDFFICKDAQAGNKEVNFFNSAGSFAKGSASYLSHFGLDPSCQNRTHVKYLDGTPSYLQSVEAAQRMRSMIPRELHPKLRFVAVLREPVARHLSWWNMQEQLRYLQKKGGGRGGKRGQNTASRRYASLVTAQLKEMEGRGWGKEWTGGDALQDSFFDEQIQRWCESFPREQLMVVNYETLVRNASDTLQRIVRFLGLEPYPAWAAEAQLEHKLKRSGAFKLDIDQIPAELCAAMQRVFAPHNQRLYQFLREAPPEHEPPFFAFGDPCSYA